MGEGPFALGASASSGLPVSYNSSNLAVLTVSGATATVAGAGGTVVTATQPGNGNYLAALPVSQPLAVGPVVAWGNNTYGQGESLPGLAEVVAVSSHRYHNVALRPDGTVAAWGSNDSGQTNVPAHVTNVVAVAAGGTFSAALRGDGRVATWGYVGGASVPASATNVVGIGAGIYHVLALRADGTVVAWGLNSSNQCAVPGGLGGVVAVAAGYYHSLALKADGTVVGWGSATSDYWAPPAGLTGVVSISGGLFHSVALKRDGTVVCWGANNYGQSAVPGGLSNVVAISAGHEHTAALKADGTVVCWGLNNNKQSAVPGGLGEVAALSAGYYHTAALLSRSYQTPAILGSRLALAAGQSAVLRVAEGCWRPGSGQWRVNGASIPGATNAWYWVGQAQAAGPHNYSFAAAGGSGAVTSQVAVLTVNPVPAAVTLANLSHTYNGSAKAAAVTTTPAGLPTSVTYNDSATLPVNAGSYTVVARVSDPNYAGAATNTLVINKASQTIAFGALPTKYIDDAPFTLTGTVSSGLPVSYTSGNPNVAMIQSNLVILSGSVGSSVITASQSGDANYLPASSVARTLNVIGVAPSITVQPKSQTNIAGATVTLTVGAAGSNPLRYQWFRGSQPIAGATNGELWLTNVTQADSGGYHCAVTNVINSAGSAVAWLVVIPPEGIMVVRTLPPSYKPGEKILVELAVIIATTKTVYGLEDQPPVGWTISNPSDGVLDTNHHKVKFGPFYDSAPRSFTYEVTVPMDEHNVCEFAGSVGFEKIVSSITGDSIIGPLRHPADLNPADFVMTLGEAIAYGHAWKLGESWPEAPTTIDIDYATRAAALWRGGENYWLDINVSSNAPLIWVNVPPPAPQTKGIQMAAIRSQATVSVSDAKAVRVLTADGTGFLVTIQVTPASEAQAWAAQDRVPAGSAPDQISDGGVFDAESGLVKWGPFFDGEARTLSYRAVGGRTNGYIGRISCDGMSASIGGQGTTRLAALEHLEDGAIRLRLDGALPETGILEFSTDLTTWQPVAAGQWARDEFGLRVTKPQAARVFYRLRLE